MNKDYSHLVIILDRSGSMASCVTDMEGGLNTFVKNQQKEKGKCTFTFVKFDTEYEKPLDFVDIQLVGELKLEPRGGTALLDALARAITETGNTLSNMNENDRPGLVIVVVITDGAENSSKHTTSTQLKQMIETQTNTYGWHFNYLGANQDAFLEGGNLGLNVSGIANYNTSKGGQTFDIYSQKVSSARCSSSNSRSVDMGFTDLEREEMV